MIVIGWVIEASVSWRCTRQCVRGVSLALATVKPHQYRCLRMSHWGKRFLTVYSTVRAWGVSCVGHCEATPVPMPQGQNDRRLPCAAVSSAGHWPSRLSVSLACLSWYVSVGWIPPLMAWLVSMIVTRSRMAGQLPRQEYILQTASRGFVYLSTSIIV